MEQDPLRTLRLQSEHLTFPESSEMAGESLRQTEQELSSWMKRAQCAQVYASPEMARQGRQTVRPQSLQDVFEVEVHLEHKVE